MGQDYQSVVSGFMEGTYGMRDLERILDKIEAGADDRDYNFSDIQAAFREGMKLGFAAMYDIDLAADIEDYLNENQ